MKMTKAQLEKAIFETVENESLAGDLGVRIVANAFVKYAGIEIVPDPEPELPKRPWRVVQRVSEPREYFEGGVHVSTAPLGPCVEDADGNRILVVMGGWAGKGETELLEYVVSAVATHNAAGERKRIDFRQWYDGLWRAKFFGDATHPWGSIDKEAAIGQFVMDHASDLGLEIVES